MKNFSAVIALALAAVAAHSQTIDRVKMTDNDLSCQQVFAEISQMDAVLARPAQGTAGGTPAGSGTAGVQVAGNVAQAALAVATSPGPFGNFGGLGGLGSMFGGLAQMAQGAASQQAAQQAAAQQQAAAVQQGQAVQAQGRKEHLTSLFLSKGCKMSDIQK